MRTRPTPFKATSAEPHDFRYKPGEAPSESDPELVAFGFGEPGEPDGPNPQLERGAEIDPWATVWLDGTDADGERICTRVKLFDAVVTWPEHSVPRRRLNFGYEVTVEGDRPSPCRADDRIYSVERIKDGETGAPILGFYHVRARKASGEKIAFSVRTEHDLVEK